MSRYRTPEAIRRDQAILLAYCAGERSDDIARRWNVSARHVGNVARRAGLARPHGRPVALPHASDAVLSDYRRFRKHYGAETAREMVGVA